MHDLIGELLQFHRRKARLLSDLQACVHDLALREPVAREQLGALLLNFDAPAETEHHHNEELLLREMRLASIPIHSRVAGLADEHAALRRLCARLVGQIPDRTVEGSVIATDVGAFVRYYDEHASNEEAILFTTADELLTHREWNRIARDWQRHDASVAVKRPD